MKITKLNIGLFHNRTNPTANCGVLVLYRIVILLLVLFSGVSKSEDKQESFIEDPLEAYDKAIEYTGFNKHRSGIPDLEIYCKQNVKLTSVSKSDLLFLEPPDIDGMLWHVVLERCDFRSDLVIEYGGVDSLYRDFNVYITQNSGRLIQVNSEPIRNDKIAENPPSDTIKLIDFNRSESYFYEYSSSIPNTTFKNAAYSAVGCYCNSANIVYGHLIDKKYDDGSIGRIWSIIGLGTPPHHRIKNKSGENDYYIWCLVDADSGKWLKMETIDEHFPGF